MRRRKRENEHNADGLLLHGQAPPLNQLSGDESEEDGERENEQEDGDDFFLENQAQSLQVQGAELQDDGQLVLEEEEVPSDEHEEGEERENEHNADDLLLDGQAQSFQVGDGEYTACDTS